METMQPIADPVAVVFEDYHITATAFSHWIEIRVVKIVGWTDATMAVPLLFDDITKDITDPAMARPFLTGSIKWDGCSDWDFQDAECMVHFCGRKHATSIGRLLDRLYDLAAEHLPTWDADLAT